jgi:hypothetical protein
MIVTCGSVKLGAGAGEMRCAGLKRSRCGASGRNDLGKLDIVRTVNPESHYSIGKIAFLDKVATMPISSHDVLHQKQRETAKKQPAFCCFLLAEPPKTQDFGRGWGPRPLIISGKNSKNSEPVSRAPAR